MVKLTTLFAVLNEYVHGLPKFYPVPKPFFLETQMDKW